MEEELEYLDNEVLSQAKFKAWLSSPITQHLLLTIEAAYLDGLIDDPTEIAHLELGGEGRSLPHTDPVSETAINSAVRSGKIAVLTDLLEWQPGNLEEVE